MAGFSAGPWMYMDPGAHPDHPISQQRWYYGQTVKYMLHGSEAVCSYISPQPLVWVGWNSFPMSVEHSARLCRSVVDDMCDKRVWRWAWEVELYCRRSCGGLSLRIFRVRNLYQNNTHMVAVAYDTTTGCLGLCWGKHMCPLAVFVW